MTKIDIFSGFLGAGKTTLIKKLIQEAYQGEKLVLIENEFGEIGIDGAFMQDAGIQVNEMNSGCICCSLVGDFGRALKKVLAEYAPDRILIEPSGVGKLSDVIGAVERIDSHDIALNSFTTVVDAKKAKVYMKNFGEFFNNQVQFATTIVLSRTDVAKQEVIDEAVALIREVNPTATIITTPLALLTGKKLLEILEEPVDLKAELMKQVMEEEDEEEECCCHHHHDDDDDEHEHHHEHHHHHHHHHHGHDADEIFQSWGLEHLAPMDEAKLKNILDRLATTDEFGTVVRCKGMVSTDTKTEWLYFDLVPGEVEIRKGTPDYTGKVCVIGSDLKEELLEKEFKA